MNNNRFFVIQVIEKTTVQQKTNRERSVEGDEESTSNSSFYSSFLKTDTGSGSNEDTNNPDVKTESNDNQVREAMVKINNFCYFITY